MIIKTALQEARTQLALLTENPQLEAEALLAYVLHKPRSHLYARPNACLTTEQDTQFHHCLTRRCQQEPFAYITGTREFWSHDLRVTKDTLIPRPETELIVESVLAAFPEHDSQTTVADLGTGSGAIGLSLACERPQWQIYATDISQSALAVARGNAQRLGVRNVSFYAGNWCNALPHHEFDIIVSNPPYLTETEWEQSEAGLKFEPHLALVAGEQGLDAIHTIAHSAKLYLKSYGYLFIEHGFSQGAAVRDIFSACGYCHIHTLRDLAERERMTMARFYG